jgi:molybdopterin synthase catalytic subunit
MAVFSFSREPLDPSLLAADLADESCGALVTFEGRVRNHSDGRAVERLEYEAYEVLGLAEGQRILCEALARFRVVHARCVHRLGSLALGDLAVWVGVSAHHRDEAFAACRYVIDEVKDRVPIWKKEFYAGGDSGWVNCQRPPAG